jgi:hypothetical protein
MKKDNLGRFVRMGNLNDSLFSSYTILSCYIAGVLAADGCVVNDRLISLTVSEKDLDYLNDLVNAIGFTGNINGPYKSVIDGREFYHYQLSVSSKKWVSDLYNNFNITQKKTLTLKKPNLNVEDKKTVLSFIAGYIDGDGSIGQYSNKNGHQYAKISVCGTKEILDWVKETLSEFGYKPAGVYKIKSAKCYQMAINGYEAVRLYKEINKLGLPLNKRKWGSLDEFLLSYSPTRNKYDLLRNVTKEHLKNGLTIQEISSIIKIPFQTIYEWKAKGLLKC